MLFNILLLLRSIQEKNYHNYSKEILDLYLAKHLSHLSK